MDYSIRKIEESEAAQYKAIRFEAFQKSSSAFSESIQEEQGNGIDYFKTLMGFDKEHFTLGVFSPADELVGIATLKRDPRFKGRHKAFIYTMYVSPRCRGRKLGKRLLSELILSAKAMPGLEQIHLWVLNPESSVAKKLYEQAGFQDQGPVLKKDLIIDGRYIDAQYMTLSWA